MLTYIQSKIASGREEAYYWLLVENKSLKIEPTTTSRC
jgi:hypothetical protein